MNSIRVASESQTDVQQLPPKEGCSNMQLIKNVTYYSSKSANIPLFSWLGFWRERGFKRYKVISLTDKLVHLMG